ncbi:MAG: heavy metal transporter [Flavobacteriales bacterium]|nr:heavy metal transporter [Flavobacteriales bacterium]
MKSTFTIDGMTCSGCAAKVTFTLQQIDFVSAVRVDLGAMQATIEADRNIDTAEVASALADYPKYTARAFAANTDAAGTPRPSQWRTYWPLILIGLFITAVSAGIAWKTDGAMSTFMECFMGAFFLVFSFFKFLDIRGFAESYQSYDLLAKAVPAYAFIYPFLELLLGMAWAFKGGIFPVALITVLLMGFSAVGVIAAVTRKKHIKCACLGTVFNLPMSTVTIVEDLLMVVMAAAFLLP